MNDGLVNAVTAARAAGMSWQDIADGKAPGVPQYVSAESAMGSYRVMLRKRGLSLAYDKCPTCGQSRVIGVQLDRRLRR